MSVYLDTSFLCAMYRSQTNSPLAAAYFQAMPDPLEVTTLLLYEFRQATRFQIRLHRHDPSKGYPRREGTKMLADLKSDLVSGAVVVIPGVDRITIASEDRGALDQLESIVRTAFSRAGGQRSRDFSVYQLRNAGAEDVSETLQSVYTSRAGLLAFGSLVIVPETRLNALIVYGSRTDRDRIEQLLEILDTEKLPDSGRVFRTEVVEVRHADAAEIEEVIQGVYRTELSAGGSRRAIEIPAGIDSSVASVLRQINAQSSAPLLTVEVQRETNSLVLKAPQNLIEEIGELVRQLDETSSASRARSVRLLPLERVNSRRVMQVLDEVLGR